MKQQINFIDYGIYIDRKHAFITALNHSLSDELISSERYENKGVLPRSTKIHLQQVHLQNERNEQLKKFCKLIIGQLEKVHHITIFGPSSVKYELEKEIGNIKRLKHITVDQPESANIMTLEGAESFVRKHYREIYANKRHASVGLSNV